MQANKGTHCSLSQDASNRQQCATCHDYEREQAADKASLYAKKNLSSPMDQDPLAIIANICLSLTYGEMIELGKQIYSWSTTEVSGKPINEEALVKLIHEWSKNYGMDNNVSSNSNALTNTVSIIDDLIESEERTGGSS